jgi:LysM domain
MSVAFELEYQACRPRLYALADLPAQAVPLSTVRRRRVVAVAVAVSVAAMVVLLALPLRAFGGSTLAQVAPSPGADYIVKPGDTLASIATRADSAHAGILAAQMAREVGSSVVVPGEHLHIP